MRTREQERGIPVNVPLG